MNKNVFKPRCLNHKRAVALGATGYLYPCCWTDLDPNFDHFKATNLHISNVASIEEIIESEVWQNHFKVLENDPANAPQLCKRMCSVCETNPNRDKIILE